MELKSGDTQVIAKVYTHKPVPMIAAQLTEDNIWQLAAWSNSRVVQQGLARDNSGIYDGLDLKTSLGTKRVRTGDYIVFDPEVDRFYHITKAIFESRFDEDTTSCQL